MIPKQNIQNEIYKLLWLFLILLTGALLYYYVFPAAKNILAYFVPVLLPFIVALVIAMLIEPLVELSQKKIKLNRTFSTITVMAVFMLFFGAVLVFLISRLLVELNKLAEMIPIWSQWLAQYDAQALLTKIKALYFSLHVPDYVLKVLQETLNSVLTFSKIMVSNTINGLVAFLASLPYIFMVSVVTMVATFFLSKDKTEIQQSVLKRLKPESASKTIAVMEDLNEALAGFFRAQLLLLSITGLETIIGLSLLGVDYAMTIGVATAIAEFLPIIGTGTIFVPWIVFEFIVGNARLALALLVLYAIIVIVRQIIEPKILSKNIGLHPLPTLMSLFIGLKIMGAWGIILGPTTLVILKSLRKANFI